jgi:formate hydrogenlyase subunit 3/multisubunit Na+/H+ antiporter MnhD subunit
MDTPLRRHLFALGFALFWSTFMVLWSGDYGIANIVILAVCGVLAGYFWVWAMVRIQRRREARSR